MPPKEHVRYMDRPAAGVAERVLTETFGGRVRLGAEEPLKAGVDLKSNVRRCRVEAGPPGCPASVVLKRIVGSDRYNPADVRPKGGSYGLPTMAWRLLAEWASTRVVGDLLPDVPPTPRCWGGDRGSGVVVLADLGPGETRRRLLDFESPRSSLCLTDGMFLHLYPWTHHRLPADLKGRMETTYRVELARGCPEADDDTRFGQAYTAARAVLTVGTVAYHLAGGPLETDLPVEDHSMRVEGEDAVEPRLTNRQRILLLLENFAAEARARGHLPALGDVAREAASRLRPRWQAEPCPQPLYPAFQGLQLKDPD